MRWRLEKTVWCLAGLGEQETNTGNSQDLTVETREATCCWVPCSCGVLRAEGSVGDTRPTGRLFGEMFLPYAPVQQRLQSSAAGLDGS